MSDPYTEEELAQLYAGLDITEEENVDAEEFWENKYVEIFGDRNLVVSLLQDAGVQLPEDTLIQPESWKQFFLEKYSQFQKAKESEGTQTTTGFREVQQSLKQFQQEQDMEHLINACQKIFSILDVNPGNAGCYHLLGFICYLLNSLHQALTLLQIGKSIDESYEPIDELEQEIHGLLDEIEGDEGEQPLLEGNELSEALKSVLEALFSRFDVDQDGALNMTELNEFVFQTNGTHPPPPFFQQLCHIFDSNSHGLTKQGFFEFFLQQSMDDPLETRQDLAKHGFDPKTFAPSQC
ncbi:hypothetical protein K493DRAFT_259972 [Basidiobolus meristosporus CBS 931.73]|uniref:EF-hand domain-containing protein n=1 Tax=Basidiobolus meristosporus CBS 931.73 TaxID=1314790 RepID=A0A1Y1YDP7_9FUNG|nr:hypothetical protein K493DRAFT_259972 [Basidiobolus meristosporus CBS 931.73]|eukprot:ORX96117.1 hypothetical protein K493DRAFT_259972 [Basidiobolus meristosporus CBS 931.73]